MHTANYHFLSIIELKNATKNKKITFFAKKVHYLTKVFFTALHLGWAIFF